ncbi:MAG: FliO/MopB family protein [Magnetococcales bacterium]|nr:FliO/MopB family protein [Magnetococcales bacterium]
MTGLRLFLFLLLFGAGFVPAPAFTEEVATTSAQAEVLSEKSSEQGEKIVLEPLVESESTSEQNSAQQLPDQAEPVSQLPDQQVSNASIAPNENPFLKPFKADPESEPVDLLTEAVQITGYLIVVIALGVLAVRFGRKFQPAGFGDRKIELLAGRNLSPGVGVRLIRVGGRSWLVGVTKEQLSVIAELSKDDLSSFKE